MDNIKTYTLETLLHTEMDDYGQKVKVVEKF